MQWRPITDEEVQSFLIERDHELQLQLGAEATTRTPNPDVELPEDDINGDVSVLTV